MILIYCGKLERSDARNGSKNNAAAPPRRRPHASAHIIAREGGAHAALGGFQITPLPGDDGQFTPETFRAALHPRSRYQPPQTVVSVEQTANIGGGTIWQKRALDEVVAIAPKVGRPSRQSWRRRLSGAGFAEVKAETPQSNGRFKMGDHHRDKSVAYRATLFLTLRAWLAMIPAQAASKNLSAKDAFMTINGRRFLAAASDFVLSSGIRDSTNSGC